MRTGISTACLYPLETEQSLDILLRQGFKTLEIFTNCHSELEDAYTQEISLKVQEYNAEIYSLHPYTSGFEPFLFFTNYHRRYIDALGQYGKFFRAAKKMGAEVVVFHGDRKDGLFDLDEYCERLSGLIKTAQDEGIILAQENVCRCKSGKADFIKGIRRNLGGSAKFVLDIKQVLRAGESIQDMIEAMGENIVNVHINDNNDDEDCMLPGCGSMNYSKLIHMLKGQNYNGPLLIEVYRNNIKIIEDITVSGRFLSLYLD